MERMVFSSAVPTREVVCAPCVERGPGVRVLKIEGEGRNGGDDEKGKGRAWILRRRREPYLISWTGEKSSVYMS